MLSADGGEPALEGIVRALRTLGTPHTVWIATQRPGQLTARALSDGTRGYFQGVLLATDRLAYFDGRTLVDALTPAEWRALREYAAQFRVRQVILYARPSAELGFAEPVSAVQTHTRALSAELTAAGREILRDLPSERPFVVRGASAWLARVPGPNATPLLLDAGGHAPAVLHRDDEGRETVALTFENSAYLPHSLALFHDLVRWVTHGLFVGERHVYMTAQIDDLLLATALWNGGTYRMTGVDLEGAAQWQAALAAQPAFGAFRLDWAFNGHGASSAAGETLTPAVIRLRDAFKWINHTWSHAGLDAATRSFTRGEIRRNNQLAADLGLPGYEPATLVTPRVSGLDNPEAMRGAFEEGVRYVVSDTSHPGQDSPEPNAGIENWHEKRILMIPRRPTNLYYDVSTPSEWRSEYNARYRSHWGRDLSYEEVLEKESDLLLQYLLRWEANPWMFHQANARLYDGRRSLLSDLLDRTAAKYTAALALPVRSPRMDELGAILAERLRFDASGVSAVVEPGRWLTLHVRRAATIPVTGLAAPGAEAYGVDRISRISLEAGESVRLPLR